MEENQLEQLSDVFTTLHILSNSLMQGHTLPAYLPKLRERLVYHEIHTGRRSINSSLIRSMFSQPLSTGTENVQAAETDSSLEGSSGSNAPIAGPETVDGSSTGMELEDLTLDVLLVSLPFFDHHRKSSVDSYFLLLRMSNYLRTLQVYVVPSLLPSCIHLVRPRRSYGRTLEFNIRKFLRSSSPIPFTYINPTCSELTK